LIAAWTARRKSAPLLAGPPVPLGRRWRDHVNKPQNEAELEAMRRRLARGRPFGGRAAALEGGAATGPKIHVPIPRPTEKAAVVPQ
jgi:hypothetical protein